MGFDLDGHAAPEIALPGPGIPTTLDDFDMALARVAEVLRLAEPTKRGTWRLQSVGEHVRHALIHLHRWQHVPSAEDLDHALCRLAMAVQLDAEGRS